MTAVRTFTFPSASCNNSCNSRIPRIELGEEVWRHTEPWTLEKFGRGQNTSRVFPSWVPHWCLVSRVCSSLPALTKALEDCKPRHTHRCGCGGQRAGVTWVWASHGGFLEATAAANPCAVATWWPERTRHVPLALLVSPEFYTHPHPHPLQTCLNNMQ